ncbi:MAG TPA: hypothetical protein VK458_18985 [Myxococcaceae bacterium]|nr:hypothetical protein [Myxococcaceae bacterium]
MGHWYDLSEELETGSEGELGRRGRHGGFRFRAMRRRVRPWLLGAGRKRWPRRRWPWLRYYGGSWGDVLEPAYASPFEEDADSSPLEYMAKVSGKSKGTATPAHNLRRSPRLLSKSGGTGTTSRLNYVIGGGRVKKGTSTNKKARLYAQAALTPQRYGETMTYKSGNGNMKTVTFMAKNPKEGAWQAGHKQAKQIGGSGTILANIFPQNPNANMFPFKGRQYTLAGSHRFKSEKWKQVKDKDGGVKYGKPMSWREWEDKKRRKANKYGNQDISVVWTGYYR